MDSIVSSFYFRMPFYILLLLSLELLNAQVAIPKSYLVTEVQVLCNMTVALPTLKKTKFPWNCTQAQQKIGSWCSWTGVTCAPNGGTGNTIITSIGLSKQKIAGSIPNAIGLLTTLQFLFLDQNALVGTIPSSIGRLNNLQTLHLENNYLSGTLPSSLTTLTNLVVLNVNNNYLTGTLSTDFITKGFMNDDYFGTAMTYNNMNKPTGQPTNKPTFGYRPSRSPTPKPSTPTGQPTQRPSGPTKTPTLAPTKTPTKSPTLVPTRSPTMPHSWSPSISPTMEPTVEPTAEPSMEPTAEPSTLAPSAGAVAAAKATLPPGSIAAAVILSVFGFCCLSYLCYFWVIPTMGVDTGGAAVSPMK